MKVETVKVVNENAKNGYMIINKNDFDENSHKIYGEKDKPGKKSKKGKKG